MNIKSLLLAGLLGSTALASANDMFFCSVDGEGGGDDTSGGGSTALTGGTADAPEDKGADVALYGNDDKSGNDPKPDDTQADDKPDDKAAWKEYENDPDKTDEENAAAKAEHDKAKPKADDKDKKEEQLPVKAEEYEFVEVPEGFELDPAVDKEFREFASRRGWSKEDVKELSAMQVKLYAKQSEAHAEQVATWGEELKTDKEIGGRAYDQNIAKAREAKNAFFPPEADAIFDRTGLGNHPAIVKGLVRIGKAMGEMATLPGKGKTANTTVLESLYGSE